MTKEQYGLGWNSKGGTPLKRRREVVQQRMAIRSNQLCNRVSNNTVTQLASCAMGPLTGQLCNGTSDWPVVQAMGPLTGQLCNGTSNWPVVQWDL